VADLLTHTAGAWLLKEVAGQLPATRPWANHRALFVVGAVAPDALGRIPWVVLGTIHQKVGGVPAWMAYIWEPLHMPLGMLLMAWIGSLAMVPHLRAHAFRNLGGGMLSHLALDLAQSHMGVGYPLFFPLSMAHWELGLWGTEATVWVAIPLFLTALVLNRRAKGAPKA